MMRCTSTPIARRVVFMGGTREDTIRKAADLYLSGRLVPRRSELDAAINKALQAAAMPKAKPFEVNSWIMLLGRARMIIHAEVYYHEFGGEAAKAIRQKMTCTEYINDVLQDNGHPPLDRSEIQGLHLYDVR